MANPMTLHVLIGCPESLFAMLTVKAANLPVKFKYHTKQADFGSSLPSLSTEEGNITNVEAIVRYLSGLKAYLGVGGQSAFDKAQVDLWMDMVRTNLSTGCSIRRVHAGCGEWTQEGLDESRNSLMKGLERFEEHLGLRSYFVGHSVTLADLAFTACLANNRSVILDAASMKSFPNVNRHFLFMTNTTFFQAVMGRSFAAMTRFTPLADSEKTKEFACNNVVATSQVPTGAPAENKKGGKAEGKGKGKGKGQGEGKKAAPKKAEKKVVEAPVKVEKPALTAEEQATLDADRAAGEWFFNYKTLFTNSTDRNAAIDTLATEWDPKHFSMWHCKYDKMPKECKDELRTSNMISFFYKGLEGLNKDTLSVHGAYGPESDHDIMGVWMFKGAEEVHPKMKDHNQYEYFEWTKLDMANAENVATVKEFWLNTNPESYSKVMGTTPLITKLFK